MNDIIICSVSTSSFGCICGGEAFYCFHGLLNLFHIKSERLKLHTEFMLLFLSALNQKKKTWSRGKDNPLDLAFKKGSHQNLARQEPHQRMRLASLGPSATVAQGGEHKCGSQDSIPRRVALLLGALPATRSPALALNKNYLYSKQATPGLHCLENWIHKN